MTKDEMKNKISMALKSPTLQQGFEIICKNLSELKKENAELKSAVDFQTSSNMDRYFQLKRSKEKLTKAKEIIQHFVNECKMCRAYPEKYKMWYQEIEEAEQFLKEE